MIVVRYIDEENIKNKKVLLRCDFNVPIQNGIIKDETRIIKALKTIEYLLENNCAVILMSHFGRVKSREDKINNSLKLVAEKVGNLLGKDVKFMPEPVGMDVLSAACKLNYGELMMLENTRFCDYPENLESGNDLNLAKYWASLADIFVVDAFATLHRCHASVAGISKFIPTYYGFLVKEEMVNLAPTIDNIERPFGVFMGGAKVDDKLKYIKNVLKKCDYLFLGGGIANSFLYACGYDVLDSLYTKDEKILKEIKVLYDENKDKIIMPVDFVIEENKILDLNTKSIEKYLSYLKNCKTIFINGTCGKFEDRRYANGTISLFKGLKDIDAIKIAGGGDTLNAINSFDLEESFTFLSSGGGASLEYISSSALKAIDFAKNNE